MLFKELNLCFQKLVSGQLHTLYWGDFPDRGLNPGPWSKTLNRQQYMGKRSNQLSHGDNPTRVVARPRPFCKQKLWQQYMWQNERGKEFPL